MSKHTRTHPVASHKPVQKRARHLRPSTIALATQYREALEAVLALVSDMDGYSYQDAGWQAYVGRLVEARWQVTVLAGKLLAACGYNTKVARRLRGR